MASKKGITVTVIILVSITLASFIFWLIPQENEATFSVSDYQNYLDGVKNVHDVLDQEIDSSFNDLIQGDISSDEYIIKAETTSDQVVEQISSLVTSKPSEEWQESYINYMDALRKFNSQIRETVVLAEIINSGEYPSDKYDQSVSKINELESEIDALVNLSEQSRP